MEQQQHRRAHHRRQRAEHRVVTEHHHRVEKERDQTEQIGRKLFGEERQATRSFNCTRVARFAALAAGEEAHRQMQHPGTGTAAEPASATFRFSRTRLPH